MQGESMWRLCHFFFLLFLFPSPAPKATKVTELQHRSSKPNIVNLDKLLSFWRTRGTGMGHELLWHEEQKMLYVNYISIKLRDNVQENYLFFFFLLSHCTAPEAVPVTQNHSKAWAVFKKSKENSSFLVQMTRKGNPGSWAYREIPREERIEEWYPLTLGMNPHKSQFHA